MMRYFSYATYHQTLCSLSIFLILALLVFLGMPAAWAQVSDRVATNQDGSNTGSLMGSGALPSTSVALQKLFSQPSLTTQQPIQSNSPPSNPARVTAGLSSQTQGEPLPPEQAFALSASRSADGWAFQFDVAKGYYLYRDKIRVEATDRIVLSPSQLPPGKIKYDDTFAKNVATFVDTLKFFVSTQQLVSSKSPSQEPKSVENKGDAITAKAQPIFTVYSQGCADIGICYPPQAQRVTFSQDQTRATIMPAVWRDASAQVSATASSPPKEPRVQLGTESQNTLNPPDAGLVVNQVQGNSNEIRASSGISSVKLEPSVGSPNLDAGYTDLLQGESLWLVAFSFIGFGMLLSLTPCVLPMVPIVASIVLGAQATSKGTAGQEFNPRGLGLSVAYVAGMATVYTCLGMAAALLGSSLTAALQQPWALTIFAVLMTLLAFSQFGWFELKLPNAWINWLNGLGVSKIAHPPEGETLSPHPSFVGAPYLGATLMGAISALMVGPCITAPLAATLAYIAQSGHVITGGLALLCLSLGMGVPLLLVGLGGAKYLPKAGAWMVQVQFVFGLMLLALALWTVQSLLPDVLLTLGYAVLLLMLAMTLLDIASHQGRVLNQPLSPQQVQPQTSTHLLGRRLLKACAGLLCLWVGMIVLGAAAGHWSAVAPLKGVFLANTSLTESISAAGQNQTARSTQTIKTPTFVRVRTVAELDQQLKRLQGGHVMLDFYADWCVSCVEMEKFTFSNPKVAQELSKWTLLQVDVTKNSEEDGALLKKMGLFGPPALMFFDPRGQERPGTRVIGFMAAERFLNHLQAMTR